MFSVFHSSFTVACIEALDGSVPVRSSKLCLMAHTEGLRGRGVSRSCAIVLECDGFFTVRNSELCLAVDVAQLVESWRPSHH